MSIESKRDLLTDKSHKTFVDVSLTLTFPNWTCHESQGAGESFPLNASIIFRSFTLSYSGSGVIIAVATEEQINKTANIALMRTYYTLRHFRASLCAQSRQEFVARLASKASYHTLRLIYGEVPNN